MRSFFAMIWDPSDPQAEGQSADIRRAARAQASEPNASLDSAGFFLIDLESGSANTPAILPLVDDDGTCVGAFYGTVFLRQDDASPAQRLASIPAGLGTRILASQGECLMQACWGSYVFFLAARGGSAVINEPAASIPCHHATTGGVTLLFSHLENCPFLDRWMFTVNLSFIQRMLAYDKIQNGETGLNEVRELMGGERLRIRPDGVSTDTLWDPRRYARDVFSPSPDEAAGALRTAARTVVQAWASCYPRILLDLSGGFDSSTVLGLLAEPPGGADILPVHHRPDSLDPPETRYAAAAADHAGRPLREVIVNPARALPSLLSHPRSVRPYRQFIALDLSEDMAQAGIPLADATFTGQGGDHLFLATSSPLGFADFLRDLGLTSTVGAQLIAAARLSETSIWSVLAECLPQLLPGRRTSSMVKAMESRQTRFNADATALAGLKTSVPDWAREARGLPPAKFNQVSNLVHMFQVREPMSRKWSRQTIHPLISQPVIELCLRLPTYLLCLNGESRGLARRAFHQQLPGLIRRRMTKGDASRQFTEYLNFNRATLASALSDGELVAEGLLSASAVNEFIRRDHFAADRFGRMMLSAYAIEAWLQSWKHDAAGRPPSNSGGQFP